MGERRFKISPEEVERVAGLCNLKAVPTMLAQFNELMGIAITVGIVNDLTGEFVVPDDSLEEVQCFIRTLDCINEPDPVFDEEGIEIEVNPSPSFAEITNEMKG